MPSQGRIFIDDENKPTNIPSYETIILQSFKLRPQQATAVNTSGVRIALNKSSDLDVSNIWVKFGGHISMSEAKTQRFVSQHLQDNNISAVRVPHVYLAWTWGSFGYIVMEYIDGQMCNNSDIALAAPAVQALIDIPSPSLTPGPVGGGVIEHPFFLDRTSSIWCESVEEIEDHVNGILSETGRKMRVSLTSELASYGLRLCVSDLKAVNFMRDRDDRVVAVDFGGYSFLPPSFFAFAMRYGCCGTFAYRMASLLKCPPLPPTHVSALISASCALVPYGLNDVGKFLLAVLTLSFSLAPSSELPSSLY
ncbi:hypothetical protein DL96DRAFT_1277368 [Flagelloscypha sp. PMI_526]|nr:hypothetical protein DL96DRAFT_1277368 [Flagelloscypha sp. PMI_526]